jgi:3-hydroxyisobutyrate dehydrogenase-like beta-hydroxyacid dehydrogenase
MTSDRPRVGFIGAGLMGHGVAAHILAGGYELTVLGHRNRPPIDDLLARGATEARTAAEIAARSDVVFTFLPSSVEVEAVVLGADGLLGACRPGMVHVDSTTADPASTRRLAAQYAARGAVMLDAPVGRTPKEAEEGKLSTFIAGDPAAIARVRPIIDCYTDTVMEVGALGTGHTLKLINNFLSIANSAVVAEAIATASKLGVDLPTLYRVVSSGGANSAMFQMIMPWALAGDVSHLKGPIRIGGKDLRFYCRMAEAAGAPAPLAQAASQLYQLALARGHADRFIPVLPGILAELIGAPIRPLDDA